MLHIVWEFRVRPERVAEFERHYGSAGSWAALFAKSRGYHGSVLVRDLEVPLRYLVTDLWEDRNAFDRFKDAFGKEYEALDQRSMPFIEAELCLGYFQTCG